MTRPVFTGLAAGVLLPLCIESPAAGQTPGEALQLCEIVGDLAAVAVDAREAGVSLEEFLQRAEVGDPGMPQDLVVALIRLSYALDGVEAPVMREVAVQMCQKENGLK